nr:hypothetical protein [Tanacetum cinerariifolium]
CEMWKAIERLKQGESINVQDLGTNLYWEFRKFTSQYGESLESYYSRFYKMLNELIRNQCKVTNHQVNVQFLLQLQPEWQRFVTLVKQNQELKTVSFHKPYDILKQHQHEVNEIRAERISRVANPLALIAQQQPVYHPQTHPTHYTQDSSTRSQQTATRNKGKAIVNSPQPIYDQEPSLVAEDNETSKDKEIDKLMALISLTFKKIYKPTNNNLRTSSNTSRANQDNSSRINRSAGECQKPKRVKDAAYHREYMLLCKQEEAGIQLNAEQANWRDDTGDDDDDELEDQELEAHNIEEIDQNDDENDLANERELLASLIKKLKCEIDESKNRNKFLETSNKVLIQKISKKNKCSESSNNYFKEANNKLSETNNLMYTDYKKSEAELARPVQKSGIQCYNCKEFGHVARECQKPKRVKDAAYHRKNMLLCKQEEAGIQLNAKQANWRDDTDDDDDDELEDQELEAHNMYMAQLQEVSTDAADSGPIFDDEPLQKVSNDDHYNVFAMESEHLEQSLSVHDTYPIEQDAQNVIIDSLDMSYNREEIDQNDDENDLANERELLASLIKKLKCEIDESKNRNKFLETSNKVLIQKLKGEIEDFKNKNKCSESSNNYFKEANNKLSETNNLLYTDYKKSEAELARRNSMEYASQMEIECAKDKGIVISELKKLIEKLKGKYVDTKFEKSSVIQQLNAFKSQRPLVLGKPTTFLNYFVRKDFSKSKSVTQNNVSNDFSKPVTAQTLPSNKKSILKNTNVLAPGMYKVHTKSNQARTSQLPQDSRKINKRASFSTEVIPTTSVSRPQLKSNPMGDSVLHNNSQEKKQDVEDHHRSVKFSKILNVNSMCATCDTCVLNEKHDMCVLNSVAKPLKKTVASESNQKPINISRKLYESVSKTCSWWYPKFTPSGYKWKPKSGKENVSLNTSMPLGSVSRTANILEHITFRRSTVSNTPLSSNYFAARMVKFRNDQIAPIFGYGDLVQGAVTITRVYYVERLNHNLFSVGQFCDADLEVAF